MLIFKNPDKAFHEKWYPSRGILNFPHPWRAILSGPPHVGKTNTIINMVLHADPRFEKIIVHHTDPTYTREYDVLHKSGFDVELRDQVPKKSEFDGKTKTLIIFDDVNYKSLDKKELHRLDRLFGNWSTHKNISCVAVAQDFFQMPNNIRRTANILVIYRPTDMDAFAAQARKSGIEYVTLKYLFDNIATGKKDSIWLDMTEDTPYHYRLNGFDIIEKNTD